MNNTPITDKDGHQGHLKRPLPLVIINIVYLLVSPWYLFVFIANIAQAQRLELYNLFFFFFVMTLGSLFVAWGLWKINRIGWWAVIVHSVLVLVHNFLYLFISIKNVNFHKMTGQELTYISAILFSIIMIGVVTYFVVIHDEFRVIFFNPRLRWWESDPRYYFNVIGHLKMEDEKKLEINLEDISINGIRTHEINGINPNLEDTGMVTFKYEDIEMMLNFKIVWIESNMLGLKFINTSNDQKKNIKRIIKSLKQKDSIREGR